MDNASYAALTRQTGLLREMQVVANNIANASTTGFRRQGVVFSEFVATTGPHSDSLSMAQAHGRVTDLTQGALTQTGGTFDLAIEGPGFFQVETPQGNRLTRAGVFTPNAAGELVTPEGYRLLDSGGAAIFVPADARAVTIAADGTMAADGRPLGQVGLFMPPPGAALTHVGARLLETSAELLPAENGRIVQGFLESSNVSPVSEITRMIEIQRAYELGQKLLDQEHERIRSVMQTLSR